MSNSKSRRGRRPRKSSEFAQGLRSLLFQSGHFDRKEWCDFLGVTTSALSQWIHDDTVPKPEHLRTIVQELERVAGSPKTALGPLQEFRVLCDRPAQEVSPNGDRMAPTVGHYMLSPVRTGLFDMLSTLPHREQGNVLKFAIEQMNRDIESRKGVTNHAEAGATPHQRLTELWRRYTERARQGISAGERPIPITPFTDDGLRQILRGMSAEHPEDLSEFLTEALGLKGNYQPVTTPALLLEFATTTPQRLRLIEAIESVTSATFSQVRVGNTLKCFREMWKLVELHELFAPVVQRHGLVDDYMQSISRAYQNAAPWVQAGFAYLVVEICERASSRAIGLDLGRLLVRLGGAGKDALYLLLDGFPEDLVPALREGLEPSALGLEYAERKSATLKAIRRAIRTGADYKSPREWKLLVEDLVVTKETADPLRVILAMNTLKSVVRLVLEGVDPGMPGIGIQKFLGKGCRRLWLAGAVPEDMRGISEWCGMEILESAIGWGPKLFFQWIKEAKPHLLRDLIGLATCGDEICAQAGEVGDFNESEFYEYLVLSVLEDLPNRWAALQYYVERRGIRRFLEELLASLSTDSLPSTALWSR